MRLDEKGLIIPCPKCGQRNRIPYQRLGGEVRCGQCKTALALPSVPIEIADAAGFSALTGSSALPVFIDFWAPWCGPCKMVAPEVEKLAASADREFVVARMNTDDVPAIAQQFQISSIPTLAVFHQGRELRRISGARPAAALLAFIREALGRG